VGPEDKLQLDECKTYQISHRQVRRSKIKVKGEEKPTLRKGGAKRGADAVNLKPEQTINTSRRDDAKTFTPQGIKNEGGLWGRRRQSKGKKK